MVLSLGLSVMSSSLRQRKVTSMENRVVTHYDGYTLHYLGARRNMDGQYVRFEQKKKALQLGAKEINEYHFDTKEDVEEAVNALGGLKEGFVVWQDGKPICKVKAEAYVAAHHIRGEGLSPKRIAELVLSGECDEYLTYFDGDRPHFVPYIEALEGLEREMEEVYTHVRNIEGQKEFALAVKDFPYSSVMFTARKTGGCPTHCFHNSRQEWKVKMLCRIVGDKE